MQFELVICRAVAQGCTCRTICASHAAHDNGHEDMQGFAGRVRIEKRDLLQCLAVGYHLAPISSVLQLERERYTCVQSTHEQSVRGLRCNDASVSISDVGKRYPGETWAGNSTSASAANATGKKWRRHIVVEPASQLAAARQESRRSDQQPKEACAGSGRTEETSTSDDMGDCARWWALKNVSYVHFSGANPPPIARCPETAQTETRLLRLGCIGVCRVQ